MYFLYCIGLATEGEVNETFYSSNFFLLDWYLFLPRIIWTQLWPMFLAIPLAIICGACQDKGIGGPVIDAIFVIGIFYWSTIFVYELITMISGNLFFIT
ncbi:hypothetical protein HOD29_05130 [archaeon]|nr:hypothetical protein [archaeon]